MDLKKSAEKPAREAVAWLREMVNRIFPEDGQTVRLAYKREKARLLTFHVIEGRAVIEKKLRILRDIAKEA